MSEEKKIGLSRREFLKDAGLVVGGATIGSMAFLSACGDKPTPIKDPTFVCPLDGKEFESEAAWRAHFASAHPFAEAPDLTSFDVNGTTYAFQVGPMELLSYTLRERLGLYGLKVACDMGACGACTVLVDDLPVYSCLTLSIECSGKKITTLEGLSNGLEYGETQKRFYAQDAFQCGYCTPGFIMAGEGLLRKNSNPSAKEAAEGIAGNICVCGNYKKVIDALTGTGMEDPIVKELGGV
ncbi:MAG: 2Fe-2S iron-sulfur cluster-binding protein [Dehalococcoidia bacterium]|nr:2Fe-2S iron-sulfur cluster-binding protein [Dehalococcoidia bacterium]